MKVEFDENDIFVGEVSLREASCSLEIKNKGTEPKVLRFRLLTPEVEDGHWKFEEDIIRFLLRVRGETNGEERARCERILRMIKFHRLFPPYKQMRGTRKFQVDFGQPRPGKEPTTWFELARDAGIKDAMDLIMHVTKRDKVRTSPTKLLAKAIYREPILEIPFSQESYCRFREFFMRMWEALDDVVVNVAVPKMLRGEKDPVLEKMCTRDPFRYKKATVSSQESEKFIMRQLLEDELEDQERIAERYGPTLERAENLYRKYSKKTQARKNHVTDDVFSKDFDSLMNECIRQFRADIDRKKLLRLRQDEMVTEEKQAYIDSLTQSVRSKDVGVKWSALIELIENLTYRSNAIRLMQREAEGAWLELVQYGISEIYRKIRRNLTVPEKRAFILVHYRRYKVLGKRSPVFPFGGRIPGLDRIIWDFFRRTGEKTGALVYSVLVFKYPTSAKLRNYLAGELRHRWLRYLLFYPVWQEIQRRDEKEDKHQRAWRKRKLSLETPVGEDEGGNIATLEDTVGTEDVSYLPEVSEKLKSEKLRNEAHRLIDTRCTPREAEILKLGLDGYSQQEIAEIIGKKEGKPITQQAISKIMKKTLRKIEEGDWRTK